MKSQIPGDIIKKLQESLNEITNERSKGLSDLKDIQIIKRGLLQHEEKRLNKKLGKDHPRTQQLKGKLEHNLEFVKDLEVELEIAKIKIPEVPEDETLIHGRVVDENYRGIKELAVYMTDDKGKVLANLGKGKVDDSGYYSIVANSDTIEGMSEVLKEGVFLTVRDKKDKVIHRYPDPIKIIDKDRIFTEIVLDKEDLITVRETAEKISDEDENAFGPDTWVVWGRVTDEKDRGIGGLVVSVYDKDMTFDDRLGTTLTDEEGFFRTSYLKEDFQDLIAKNPDIHVKVLDKKEKTLYSSEEVVKYEAGRADVFNIIIKEKAKPKDRS